MTTPTPLYIVGIGASAGGIEALEGFFRGAPVELDAAYLITTHLSPDRHSLLAEILGRYTALPVMSAVDGAAIASRHVYVMPEATIMTVSDGLIKLHEQTEPRERKPVDILFGSLADAFKERAVGIVLSGGDSDGTLGLKAIKARGGITMAQVADGYGPRHHGMPDTAIAAGVADFGLPVEAMGPRLLALSQADALVTGADDGDAVLPTTEGAMSEDRLHEIYALLRSQVGHDFSGYKSKTFVRRVLRRMQVAEAASVSDYIALLRSDAKEVNALFRDLLINVTSFFRDTEAFDALASSVIPALFKDKGAADVVRIWVPGCATGEEVYSMAILVLEHLDTLPTPCRVQIFATDIDDRALAVARAARYPLALMEAVSDERRQRFFSFESEAFVVSKRVRDLCIFSPHSVIRDPPFSRIDLVSCRNLLIYFGADVQNQVIPIFHYALKPGGFLFLGSAENVTQFGEFFEAIDKRHRIFRRRSDGTPSLRLPILIGQAHSSHPGELVPRRSSLSGMALRQVVDQQVLERFGPPHVVVNRDGDVIFYSTRTGKYLEPPAGAPTRQLLTMARKDLRLDLRTLFREALESGRPTSRADIHVELDDQRVQVLSVHIEPLRDNAGAAPLFLVLFVDQAERPPRSTSGWENFGDEAREQMERELHETRDRLQSMIEEYETALEELKSSNEELVSVNEEMQSTNEELEASKEELQSLNEELNTVNGELHGKLESLDRANSDLVNLFAATNVATIFLDQNLVIRTFTPAVSSVFNIRGTDRGRPITDLSSQLVLPTLTDDIARVFRDKEPLEKTARNEDGTAHFLVRLAPYVDALARIEGVVATFLDVTSLTVSEARQRTMVAELQHRTRNLLTIVETIARKTLSDNAQLDQFAVRLGALSRVQGLIGGKMNEAIDLGDILRLEMDAHSASAPKVSIHGPHVALGYDVAQTMCLALHELTTNAVKYGALKGSSGSLDVSWRIKGETEAPRLSLLWKESGVLRSAGSIGTGFGRELIERALAFTLRATVSWMLEDDGVRCQIDLPLAAPGPSR